MSACAHMMCVHMSHNTCVESRELCEVGSFFALLRFQEPNKAASLATLAPLLAEPFP